MLEQYLPAGPNHAFAQTMLKHFQKLQTPLRSVLRYPSLSDQEDRFRGAGWAEVVIRNLWEMWGDNTFLSPLKRLSLDAVEPFDEWEEFALFASHYFLLVARTRKSTMAASTSVSGHTSDLESDQRLERQSLHLLHNDIKDGAVRRKFGAPIRENEHTIALHGGHSPQIRLASTDMYAAEGQPIAKAWPPSPSIKPRMCHTITDLGSGEMLLVGGRASPSAAMADCWLRKDKSWLRVHDMPGPRYRHSAVMVRLKDGTKGVVIFGGKDGEGRAAERWLLWNATAGWQALFALDKSPIPRYGANLFAFGDNTGVIFGGMRQDGTVLSDLWIWRFIQTSFRSDINCQEVTGPEVSSADSLKLLGRFGASMCTLNGGVLVLGGIRKAGCITPSHEAMVVYPDNIVVDWLSREAHLKKQLTPTELHTNAQRPLPLFVGHTLTTTRPGQALMLGGGAVCFSFGSFWNDGVWLVKEPMDNSQESWELRDDTSATVPKALHEGIYSGQTYGQNIEACFVDRLEITSAAEFANVVGKRQPKILENMNIGHCTERWTLGYLNDRIGTKRRVVVHHARSSNMNFQMKNFTYATMTFAAFLDAVKAGKPQYLRSVAAERPSEVPANLRNDFPEIADDFQLPPELDLVADNAHSSPLRISGPVTMWLHYDVSSHWNIHTVR